MEEMKIRILKHEWGKHGDSNKIEICGYEVTKRGMDDDIQTTLKRAKQWYGRIANNPTLRI